jgi:hypothetical protein
MLMPAAIGGTMLRKRAALFAVFGIAGAALAGCGSGSPGQQATVASHQTPLASNPDVGRAQQQSSRPASALGQLGSGASDSAARAGNSRVTGTKVVPARKTPDSTRDEQSDTGAKPLNPCRLVSLSEAQTITGGAVTKLIEAPLGPTCIYKGRGSTGITLAVETESFRQIVHQMGARKHVVISGRRSVCGRLGEQMLFVPLGRYQLLSVTAPCRIAKAFATVALGRLSA